MSKFQEITFGWRYKLIRNRGSCHGAKNIDLLIDDTMEE
jgi:hypothetical protein